MTKFSRHFQTISSKLPTMVGMRLTALSKRCLVNVAHKVAKTWKWSSMLADLYAKCFSLSCWNFLWTRGKRMQHWSRLLNYFYRYNIFIFPRIFLIFTFWNNALIWKSRLILEAKRCQKYQLYWKIFRTKIVWN